MQRPNCTHHQLAAVSRSATTSPRFPPKITNVSAEFQAALALGAHSVPQAPPNDTLAELEPLRWRLTHERPEAALWSEFLARYHPLGHRQLLGCHLRYVLKDRQGGDWAACCFRGCACHACPPRRWSWACAICRGLAARAWCPARAGGNQVCGSGLRATTQVTYGSLGRQVQRTMLASDLQTLSAASFEGRHNDALGLRASGSVILVSDLNAQRV